MKMILPLLLLVVGTAQVQAFVPPSSTISLSKAKTSTKTTTTIFMSDIPKDETKKKKSKRKQQPQSQQKQPRMGNWKDDWWPEPPQDQLTLSGDVASLFLYAFMDHFVNDVFLASVLESSSSAADAAQSLGTEVMVQATPVWLDSTAVGPHTVDHVLFLDLQSRVMPHFAPTLSSAGMASVSLASCWILAGLFHKAFHFQNTLDCPTERTIAVTGQTWITSSVLLLLLTCVSQHMTGVAEAQDVSTSVLMAEGRILTPIEEWIMSALTRADFEYIVDSLGVLLTWRFLISFMMGGWSKK